MKFEFDPKKNLRNRELHGVDFTEAQELWEGSHVIIPAKNVMGEERYAILGKIKGQVYMSIYTEREDVVRMISCHRTDKKWGRIYHEYLKKREKES